MKIIKVEHTGVIDEAFEIIKNGGVVVVPTDTVYGLAADAQNEKAVNKVFEIKGRPTDKKLPVFVSSFEMLNEIIDFGKNRVLTKCLEPGSNQQVLAFLRKVWPGKITCVLPAKGGDTIGVRMPNHDLLLKIIEKLGRPITGTSANRAGKTEHTKISELIKEFTGNIFPTVVGNMLPEDGKRSRPDLVLDSGDLPPSKTSTVLDCTIWPPKTLREGVVSEEELKKLLSGDILK